MSAILCNVCNDSKTLFDNPILICKACGVGVHQICYRIKELPKGGEDCFYCRSCKYLLELDAEEKEKEKKKIDATSSNSQKVVNLLQTPLPTICCELCPVKEGAFIPTRQLVAPNNETAMEKATTTTNNSTSVANTSKKWIHMSCAKWHRLPFLVVVQPSTTAGEAEEVIVDAEDVQRLKVFFRRNKQIECSVCYGKRGAYQKCKIEGCQNYLHLSCARAVGFCEVTYGENAEGPIITHEENPWTLMCIDHSSDIVDPKKPNNPKTARISQKELIEAAKELPDEDVIPSRWQSPYHRLLQQKPFHELTGEERAVVFSDPVYEKKIVTELLDKEDKGSWIRGAEESKVDSSNKSMSNGEAHRCNLCGLHEGHKIKFFTPNCKAMEISGINSSKKSLWIHVKCASQIGLEINRDDENSYGEFFYLVASKVCVRTSYHCAFGHAVSRMSHT